MLVDRKVDVSASLDARDLYTLSQPLPSVLAVSRSIIVHLQHRHPEERSDI